MSPGGLAYTASDFEHSPLVVFYEVTRACNLLCRHCRAQAQPHRHPLELDTAAAQSLLDDFKGFPKPPLVVFTGGDPIKRPDVFDLVSHGVAIGLKMAMTPSATKLVSTNVIRRLKDAGLHRLAISLDGADAATHDDFRRVPGSFARTLEIIQDTMDCGLSMQINTTITRQNFHQLDAMADLLDRYPIALWSVFFLVPTGRAMAAPRIAPGEYEIVFEKLYAHSGRHRFGIKTTEAPHYRRFLLEKQRQADGAPPISDPAPQPDLAFGPHGGGSATADLPAVAAALVNQPPAAARRPVAGHGYTPLPGIVGTNDGRGVMFISHIGEICPTGFLPIVCGHFPHDSAVAVYQRSPLFLDLRNPDKLKGKCGVCPYRRICGGSRARAYGVTGDPLAAEPDCIYVPATALDQDAEDGKSKIRPGGLETEN